MMKTEARPRGAWAALLGALACCAASCSDNQVAGTSSGVDNPALTVSFTDAGGLAARVTGDLDVYAADQNPAVDPEPLATIKVRNSAFTLVTGGDFRRAQQAAAKRAEAEAPEGLHDRTPFNLVFRTQDKTGGIALGLVYDSAARALTRFARGDSAVQSVSLSPQPLIRYTGRVAKDPVHGGDCRIYVPGSPFLATLVDSQFVLEDLPQGILPLSLIGADGKVYPVPDSLNTADSGRLYRPSTSPTGSLDTARPGDSIPAFQVMAPDAHDAYVEVPDYLEAKLVGISASDSRLSVLWKWLPAPFRLADSLPLDTSRHGHGGDFGSPPVELKTPTALRTEVRFRDDGVFRFLVTATVGTRSRSDTAVVSVRHLTPPAAAVLHPAPAESLVLGRGYTVQWQMQGRGPYTLEVSTNDGGSWNTLASHYPPPGGLQIFPWTPSPDLGPSSRCLLRISDEADTTRRAVTQDYFHLIR